MAEADDFLAWHASLNRAQQDDFAARVGQGGRPAGGTGVGGAVRAEVIDGRIVYRPIQTDDGRPAGMDDSHLGNWADPDWTPPPGYRLGAPAERPVSAGASPEDEAKAAQKAKASRNISVAVRATLKEFFTEGEVNSLAGLIDTLLANDASEDEILLKVRDSQVWKDRFKGNEIRRAKGLTVLSPAEYISVERQTRQLFQEAGMPEGFYDSRDDFHDIIGRDISPREMSRRIQNGYVKVSQSDPRIREAFSEYFGANGDAALASMFLDYNKAVDVLERHVAAATFGGTAKRFGFNVNFAKSNLAAGLGVDQGRAEQGMAEVAEMQPLFTETVTEQEDMVAEEQGFNSVFGFDANSAAAIRRRREERVARQSGAGGGSLTTAKGSLGLSVAR